MDIISSGPGRGNKERPGDDGQHFLASALFPGGGEAFGRGLPAAHGGTDLK
jgi:hypothetical protein